MKRGAVMIVICLSLAVLLSACAAVPGRLPFVEPLPPTSTPPATAVPVAPAAGAAGAARAASTADSSPAVPTDYPVEATEIAFEGPLSVVLYYPGDELVLPASSVEIAGRANPGTVISFNDRVVVPGDDGMFSLQYRLDDGLNVIEITASDGQGNQDTRYLSLVSDRGN